MNQYDTWVCVPGLSIFCVVPWKICTIYQNKAEGRNNPYGLNWAVMGFATLAGDLDLLWGHKKLLPKMACQKMVHRQTQCIQTLSNRCSNAQQRANHTAIRQMPQTNWNCDEPNEHNALTKTIGT